MSDEWYCRIQGEERGPLSFSELSGLAESRELSPEDLLRRGRAGEWMRADAVAGLFQEPSKATPEALAFAQDLAEFRIGYDAPGRGGTASGAPEESAPSAWYVKSMGLEFGPMPFGELVGMAARGVLTPADRVRQGASGEWRPAESVSSVKHALASAVRETPSLSATAEAVEIRDAGQKAIPSTSAVVSLPKAVPSTSGQQPSTAAPAPHAEEASARPSRFRLPAGVAKGIAALLVVAGAAGLLLIPRQSSAQKRYEQLSALYAEMQSLRERGAPGSEWAELAQRVKRDVVPWASAVDAEADPALRALAAAGRDHFLPMLGESRRTPGPHEREFLKRLEEARAAMEK